MNIDALYTTLAAQLGDVEYKLAKLTDTKNQLLARIKTLETLKAAQKDAPSENAEAQENSG